MLRRNRRVRSRQRGVTLLEVLVTLLILAFGMLGLAGLELRMQMAGMEAYQRAQAVVLLSDMLERISLNRGNADSYVTTAATPAYLGTGDGQATPCAAAYGAARDKCEWSFALKGASETKAGANVGAMVGARGCVDKLQAFNPAANTCLPAIYRVTVTWQGFNNTVAPALACAGGSYGTGNLQRSISANISLPLLSCQ